MNDSIVTSITTPHTTTITQGPTPSTTTKTKLFERLTNFEADMLTVVIGCFVLVIAVIAAVFAYRKRKSEKRHLKHRLEGHLELSLSATSDIGEAYTLSPYVQHILDKSGSTSRHGMGESLGSTQSGTAEIGLAARTVPVERNLSIEMLKKEEARLKRQNEQAKKQETDSTKISTVKFDSEVLVKQIESSADPEDALLDMNPKLQELDLKPDDKEVAPKPQSDSTEPKKLSSAGAGDTPKPARPSLAPEPSTTMKTRKRSSVMESQNYNYNF